MGAYNVSKAGVLALSETLSAELSGTGVGVTVLCPTFVKTNIVDNPYIEESAAKLAANLMKWTGVSPENLVERKTLDANDHGQLHVLPRLVTGRRDRFTEQRPRRAITRLHTLTTFPRLGVGLVLPQVGVLDDLAQLGAFEPRCV